MLIVEEDSRERQPVVRCERCGEVVDRARGGRAVWEAEGSRGTPYREARFVHDGCLDAYAEAAGADVISLPVDEFLRDLAANLRMTGTEA